MNSVIFMGVLRVDAIAQTVPITLGDGTKWAREQRGQNRPKEKTMEKPIPKKPYEPDRKDSIPNRPVPDVHKVPQPGGGQRSDPPRRQGDDRSAPGREDPNKRF
jgi:hypothetical protein